jgi:hypothetical protein
MRQTSPERTALLSRKHLCLRTLVDRDDTRHATNSWISVDRPRCHSLLRSTHLSYIRRAPASVRPADGSTSTNTCRSAATARLRPTPLSGPAINSDVGTVTGARPMRRDVLPSSPSPKPEARARPPLFYQRRAAPRLSEPGLATIIGLSLMCIIRFSRETTSGIGKAQQYLAIEKRTVLRVPEEVPTTMQKSKLRFVGQAQARVWGHVVSSSPPFRACDVHSGDSRVASP